MKRLLILMLTLCSVSVFSQTYFENRSEELGANIVYQGALLGAGISFYDYNGDGLDDITLAGAVDGDYVFLKNQGGFYINDALSITSSGERMKQVNWVDFDNDGDADFFATSDLSKCKLFRNDGDGVYTDISETSGIPQAVKEYFGASWGDYNNDGFLDFFLSVRDPLQEEYNELYRNNGDGTFTDVTVAAGLDLTGFLSFCSAFFDYDKDGFQDIYVANDKFFTPNLLYRNLGDGTFENAGEIAGADLFMGAMSTTIDDYDNDGYLDMYVTNFFPPESDNGVVGNAFMRNNGDGTFTNIAQENGTRFDSVGWGAVFLDANNDTDKDLYVSGNISDQSDFLEAAFYENQGDNSFLIPETAGFDGDDGSSFSNAIGDVDNDGYPEIIVMNNSFEEIYLWKNDTPQDNNWIKIKLEGTQSNRMGIGSFIEISVNGQPQYNYTLCGEGFLGQNSAYEFFGIGTADSIDYIKVNWLSGQEDYIDTEIPINTAVTIVEGTNTLGVSDFITNVIRIHPNPAKNYFTISGDVQIEKVTLFNLLGQKVKEFINYESRNYAIQELQAGMYLVAIEDISGVKSVSRLVIK